MLHKNILRSTPLLSNTTKYPFILDCTNRHKAYLLSLAYQTYYIYNINCYFLVSEAWVVKHNHNEIYVNRIQFIIMNLFYLQIFKLQTASQFLLVLFWKQTMCNTFFIKKKYWVGAKHQSLIVNIFWKSLFVILLTSRTQMFNLIIWLGSSYNDNTNKRLIDWLIFCY